MCLFIHLWRFATPEFSVPQQSPLHNPAIFSVFASSGTVTQITLLQQVAHCFLIHCNSIMSAWKAFILPAFCMCFKKRKCFLMWRQLLWNHHEKEWKCHVRIPVRDCIHIWVGDTHSGRRCQMPTKDPRYTLPLQHGYNSKMALNQVVLLGLNCHHMSLQLCYLFLEQCNPSFAGSISQAYPVLYALSVMSSQCGDCVYYTRQVRMFESQAKY